MLLFSINRSRGYENPILNIIVIELCSTGGFPLEEAHEHCFQIQSAISVVILISFQCYCDECSGYIVVILPLLAFYFCSAYILYLVYYSETQRRSYNKFESLSTEVECYKCNNFGHVAKDCRMTVLPKEPQQNNNSHRHKPQKMTWIRKKDQYRNEECTIALTAK
jgi:hypothetical protein